MDHNDIADAFSDMWQHEIKDKVIHDEDGVPQIEATNVDWGKDDPEVLKSNTMRLAQKYNHIYVAKFIPIDVEKEHNINVEGIPIPIFSTNF